MIKDLFGKIFNFNRFYGFWSQPKAKFYFHLIYGILAIHLSVYAVALARYEFIAFSLDTKITNIATMPDGNRKDRALSRIVSLSKKKILVEPVIYNIVSSIKSLIPCFDNQKFENCQELSDLLHDNKDNITNVNLEGFRFCGAKFKNLGFWLYNYKEDGVDFTRSNFKNVELGRAILKDNMFQYSKFYNVRFVLADMSGADFGFGSFDNCNLSSVNFKGSNLCSVEFTNVTFAASKLFNTNLVSANLSLVSLDNISNTELNGAYYNSKNFDANNENNDKQLDFIANKFPSCFYHNFKFPPTKFPEGFYPEAHGMIDISKW